MTNSSLFPEKELEDQLRDVGSKLLVPPTSIDELIDLLDRLEDKLAKVEQSPPESTQDALLPAMKALIGEGLLKHSDTDVKVSVASCFAEITRITAPDAPYSDELMKEIFELTVGAFQKLSHVSSRSYSKAVSVLDTVAKVRSSLVMLDLECDALVVDMFRLFLRIIRCNHPHAVFSDMESIMTLVLEESDDISWELLSALIGSVRRENQNVSSMSWKLGEKVITNCAAKLKPYLMEAVQSTGIALEDYANVLTSVCQNAAHSPVKNPVGVAQEHLVEETLLSDRTDSLAQSQGTNLHEPETGCPQKTSSYAGRSQSLLTTDNTWTRKDTAGDGESLKEREHYDMKQVKSTDAPTNSKLDKLEPLKGIDSDNEPGTLPKKRGRKPNSLMNPEEGYDHSWIGGGKMVSKLSRCRKYSDKKSESALSGNSYCKEADMSSTQEKEICPRSVSLRISFCATKTVPLSSPCPILPDGSHQSKGRQKKKVSSTNKDADSSFLVMSRGGHAHMRVKKETERNNQSKMSTESASRKKAISGKINEDRTVAPGDVSKEEFGNSEETVQQLIIKLRKIDSEDKSLAQQTDGKKRKRSRNMLVKDATEDLSVKKMVSGSTPKLKSEGLHISGREEVRAIPAGIKKLDEKLVGCNIKVWWPEDKMFYAGIVGSYHHVEKKHKILYDDGDVETLDLRKERWMLTGSTNSKGKDDLSTHVPSDNGDSLSRWREEKPELVSSKQKTKSSSRRSGTSGTKRADAAKLVDTFTSDNAKNDASHRDGKLVAGGEKNGGKPKGKHRKAGGM